MTKLWLSIRLDFIQHRFPLWVRSAYCIMDQIMDPYRTVNSVAEVSACVLTQGTVCGAFWTTLSTVDYKQGEHLAPTLDNMTHRLWRAAICLHCKSIWYDNMTFGFRPICSTSNVYIIVKKCFVFAPTGILENMVHKQAMFNKSCPYKQWSQECCNDWKKLYCTFALYFHCSCNVISTFKLNLLGRVNYLQYHLQFSEKIIVILNVFVLFKGHHCWCFFSFKPVWSFFDDLIKSILWTC